MAVYYKFLLIFLFLSQTLAVKKIIVEKMITLDGGLFKMGIDDYFGHNGEAPSYVSGVKPFKMDLHPVTNREFRKFILSKPNFLTDAETRGWSSVFKGYLTRSEIIHFMHHPPTEDEPFMIPLKGPLGYNSTILGKLDHPVVHVSKRDAAAFCFWSGKRLPSEEEWEFAARGGLRGLEYPWGDSYEMGRTNLWQGPFPENDTARDGYAGTSPVRAFSAQNKYGLRDVIGNVWEWTSTPWHLRSHTSPTKTHHFTLKGASHLDSRRGHVGHRARISTRIPKLLHYSAGNVGFRCAQSVVEAPATRPPIYVLHSEL